MESNLGLSIKHYNFDGGIDLEPFTIGREPEFLSIEFAAGDELSIPLTAHVGRASRPCVKLGQQVKKYQRIAVPDGPVSIAQHAPCSAEVIAIHEQADAGDTAIPSHIVLKCDGRDDAIHSSPTLDLTHLNNDRNLRQEVERRIAVAGIVGMGGAGFPAHLKLREGMNSDIEDFIINGVECEPLARADQYLIEHQFDELLSGVVMLKNLLQAKRTVLAIGPKLDAEKLAHVLDGSGIELLQTTSRYPAGSEKQLIQILRNEEVPLNRLPIHVGVVCFNVATIQALYRAARYAEPCISRKLTVNGRRQFIVDAPIGMSVSLLLSRMGESVTGKTEVTTAGMMMGHRLSEQSPITKLTHEISIQQSPQLSPQSSPCIRCGECAAVCPMRLQPQLLHELSKLDDLDSLQDYGLFDCIECGCCSYVCPSHIPLVKYFVKSKSDVNALSVSASRRQGYKARYSRHLTRSIDDTPAERHAALADIPATDTHEIDNELEKLKSRIAKRRESKDRDA